MHHSGCDHCPFYDRCLSWPCFCHWSLKLPPIFKLLFHACSFNFFWVQRCRDIRIILVSASLSSQEFANQSIVSAKGVRNLWALLKQSLSMHILMNCKIKHQLRNSRSCEKCSQLKVSTRRIKKWSNWLLASIPSEAERWRINESYQQNQAERKLKNSHELKRHSRKLLQAAKGFFLCFIRLKTLENWQGQSMKQRKRQHLFLSGLQHRVIVKKN